MRATESGTTFDFGKISLFDGLEPALLQRIARASCCKSVAKGERIYWPGDTPRALYHVLSGYVQCALASPVGEEKVIDILAPGQSFGLAELFGRSTYVSFAEAAEPSILLRVGKEGLLDAVAESPVLSFRVLEAVAERQAGIERDVAANSFQSGCQRLVAYLLREAGAALNPFGDTTLELRISKRLIAARIGVTAETLSRAFRELSDAGLIAVRGRKITLREQFSVRFLPISDDGEAGIHHARTEHSHASSWIERSRFARPEMLRASM
jgi:CRP-like cAMP-binding protein